MYGNNRKQNTTDLQQSCATMGTLKQIEKKKFGTYTPKDCLIEKLPKKLISRLAKFGTLFKTPAKDLGSLKMINNKIVVRQATEDDVPFLFATYLKHNWYDKTNSTLLPKIVWMNAQRKRLQNIFDENKIKIACLGDDPDLIMGYGFLDLNNEPFIYIKKHYRNQEENIEELLRKTIKGEQQ